MYFKTCSFTQSVLNANARQMRLRSVTLPSRHRALGRDYYVDWQLCAPIAFHDREASLEITTVMTNQAVACGWREDEIVLG